MGRPRKKIDPKLVQKLAEMGCTLEEIADFPGIDCNKSTISRRFATEIAKGRAVGNMSIRRKQYEIAMGGSVTMLIWLGKQWLGQADKVQQEIEIEETERCRILEDDDWYGNADRVAAALAERNGNSQ